MEILVQTKRMNPEVKARWVAALRSGEYKQGKRFLKDRSGNFCCLGVLSDLNNPLEWKFNDYCFSFKHAISSIASTVQDWSGIRNLHGTIEGLFDRNGQYCTLAGLNDNGCNFSQIADVIEYFF